MADDTKSCPMCGEQVLAVAKKCRFCGEFFNAADRPRDVPSGIESMIMPVGRAPSAIAAGYLGLLGTVPMMGLPLSIAAVVCGIIALKRIKSDPALRGKGRAWFGIIWGGLATLASIVLITLLVADSLGHHH